MLRIIAGKFKGRILTVPKTVTTRPTQGSLRGAVFNICQLEIENATFLDLFAGSGAMGFEALSRGAAHITLVETNKQALFAIEKNITLLDVTTQVSLLNMDATLAIERLKARPFDIIYVDPPYKEQVGPILEKIEGLLKPGGILFVEERFNPKKEPTPFTPRSKLLLKSSRRFGAALLHQYLAL